MMLIKQRMRVCGFVCVLAVLGESISSEKFLGLLLVTVSSRVSVVGLTRGMVSLAHLNHIHKVLFSKIHRRNSGIHKL